MQTGNIHVLNNRCIGQYPMGIGGRRAIWRNFNIAFVFSGIWQKTKCMLQIVDWMNLIKKKMINIVLS